LNSAILVAIEDDWQLSRRRLLQCRLGNSSNLIGKIEERAHIPRLATKVVVTKAQDLGVPSLENNPADAH
jgi:hypothetical protein